MALWCMRLIGPDEVHAMPSREAAQAAVALHSQAFERFLKTRPIMRADMPPPWAEVIEWPWSAESHAVALAREAG